MAVDEQDFQWVPAQDFPKQTADLRSLEGPVSRGYKVGHSSTANTTKTQPAVKRKRDELVEEEDDVMQDDGPQIVPDLKRMCVAKKNVVGVTADKRWKLPVSQRTSSLRKVAAGNKSWEKKMADKQRRKVNQLNAQEARQAYKDALTAKRKEKEAAKARKEENRKKAAQGVEVSTKTAKKLMKNKKQKNSLVTR